MGGKVPETVARYALAKMAGVKYCERAYRQYGAQFIAAALTGIYGARDTGTTVVPMLLDRFATAKLSGTREILIWGSGNARREFIDARDAADALICLMERGEAGELYNVGYGEDISIRELAQLLCSISYYEGGAGI